MCQGALGYIYICLKWYNIVEVPGRSWRMCSCSCTTLQLDYCCTFSTRGWSWLEYLVAVLLRDVSEGNTKMWWRAASEVHAMLLCDSPKRQSITRRAEWVWAQFPLVLYEVMKEWLSAELCAAAGHLKSVGCWVLTWERESHASITQWSCLTSQNSSHPWKDWYSFSSASMSTNLDKV